MTFLTGQADEQHRTQVADELHLRAGGFEGENVVLIENGHRLERIVVAGILAGVFVGNGVDADLHHAGLAGKVLSLRRHAVECIVDGKRPGKLRKGLCRFAFKIEVVGNGVLGKLKNRLSGGGRGHKAVRQIDDLIVVAVVREGFSTVGRVAFDYAAVGEIAVVVGHGVVGFVVGRLHAVVHGKGGDTAEQQNGAHGEGCRPAKRMGTAVEIAHGDPYFLSVLGGLLMQQIP